LSCIVQRKILPFGICAPLVTNCPAVCSRQACSLGKDCRRQSLGRLKRPAEMPLKPLLAEFASCYCSLGENGCTVLLCTRGSCRANNAGFIFLFGKRKSVMLRSALEDFEGSTLEAVPGLLGKLRYLALLHNGAGDYSHWGLEKVYGRGAAEKAIRLSHTSLVARILKTPLRDLVEDLERSAANAQTTNSELLSNLATPIRNALPAQSLRTSEKHLRLVLQTLSVLVQNRASANPPDASPLPPPAL